MKKIEKILNNKFLNIEKIEYKMSEKDENKL